MRSVLVESIISTRVLQVIISQTALATVERCGTTQQLASQSQSVCFLRGSSNNPLCAWRGGSLTRRACSSKVGGNRARWMWQPSNNKKLAAKMMLHKKDPMSNIVTKVLIISDHPENKIKVKI
eukprot:1647454-Amphidinium_carterae.1